MPTRHAIRVPGGRCAPGPLLSVALAALLLMTGPAVALPARVVLERGAIGLTGPDGTALLEAHPEGGLTLRTHGGQGQAKCERLTTLESRNDLTRASASFAGRLDAELQIRAGKNWQRLSVIPAKPGRYDIAVRFAGGLNPAFGMGDHGGYGKSFNLYPFRREAIYQHQGGQEMRFVSTFVVFPRHRLAMVLFSRDRKCATFDEQTSSLGVVDAPDLDGLYIFHGSMEQIYSAYRQARIDEGFADAKPDADFLRLGFESYGALAWNTSQKNIEEAVQGLIDRDYPLRWVVCGSGFWKNPKSQPTGPEGTTTSFGLWGQRYPDSEGFKTFFQNRKLRLILGLRHGFAAMAEQSGPYDPAVHGPFPRQGAKAGYFVRDATSQSPRTFKVHFPSYPVYLLDPDNAKGVDWFAEGAALWGADGFKEDFMFIAEQNNYFDDYKHNPMLAALSGRGKMMMVRNAAYALPGAILRINDTDIRHKPSDQDRIPINCLAFAASGQPNVYPDIIGGRPIAKWTDRERRYLTRMAMLSALLPSLSIGNLPWKMESPSHEAAVLKAVRWHDRYVPYIYSAAVETFKSGYPRTVTPLPVAFPDDAETYDLASQERKMYSWMLGPSLLACPLFGSDFAQADTRDIYLPAGRWMDYETGEVFEGPRTLADHAIPFDKLPAFVGGTGILVSGESGKLIAELFPEVMNGTSYTFTDPESDRTCSLRVKLEKARGEAALTVRRLPQKMSVPLHPRAPAGWQFELQPGADYSIEVVR